MVSKPAQDILDLLERIREAKVKAATTDEDVRVMYEWMEEVLVKVTNRWWFY